MGASLLAVAKSIYYKYGQAIYEGYIDLNVNCLIARVLSSFY